jgi:hypothetical protein
MDNNYGPFGAIKGSLWCTPLVSKHSKSNTSLRYSATTCFNKFSELRARFVSRSCDSLCLHCCELVLVLCSWFWLFCVYSLPCLVPSCNFDSYVRLQETSIYGDSLWEGYKWYKEDRGTQVDLWITWEGLIATLVRWDTTTWSSQSV